MSTNVDEPALRPGEELPNGRQLVAIRLLARKRHDWAGDLYAVLALTGHAGDTYATWYFIPDAEPAGYCYGGFYTDSFEAATRDYWARRAPG